LKAKHHKLNYDGDIADNLLIIRHSDLFFRTPCTYSRYALLL